jgi:hypothetical protein
MGRQVEISKQLQGTSERNSRSVRFSLISMEAIQFSSHVLMLLMNYKWL